MQNSILEQAKVAEWADFMEGTGPDSSFSRKAWKNGKFYFWEAFWLHRADHSNFTIPGQRGKRAGPLPYNHYLGVR